MKNNIFDLNGKEITKLVKELRHTGYAKEFFYTRFLALLTSLFLVLVLVINKCSLEAIVIVCAIMCLNISVLNYKTSELIEKYYNYKKEKGMN